jgi:hypothetical protein
MTISRRASGSAGGTSGSVDFARVRASAERNGGIEILGPPPFQNT